MFIKEFEKLGFTANEATVYVSLAEVGKASAQQIAGATEIPRTTVYSVLNSLIEKGLVSQDQQPRSQFFVANEPSTMLRLIETKKRALEQEETTCKHLTSLLRPFFKQRNFSVPTLQFFEGSRGVEQMLYQFTDAWHESIRKYDNTWWGYQDPTVLEHYTDWLYHHWQVRDPGLSIKLFSQSASIETKLKDPPSKREIREVPEQFAFSSTIWVCGDYILMIMTKQKPHYAFQIKDAVFADNLKTIFKLLWAARLPKPAPR